MNRPPELPSRAIVITDKVFAMAACATLLVAMAVAGSLGFLAFFAMRELALVRETLDVAKAANAHCETIRLYDEGRLSQMEKMVSLASGRPFPASSGMGGPEK